MKLSELMSGVTPSATYTGPTDNDDFVLAVDTEGTATGPADYAVVQAYTQHHEGSIDSDTKDTQYIRTGKTTTRTSAQRNFNIEGDRAFGDIFQDWVMSAAVKFGVGAKVVRKYVYFNMLTGKGEQGSLMFDVSDDQSGDAGENAGFKVKAVSTATPSDYTYATV